MEINYNIISNTMKSSYCNKYLAPDTQVINCQAETSFMETSSVSNSSQESFQDVALFESIW